MFVKSQHRCKGAIPLMRSSLANIGSRRLQRVQKQPARGSHPSREIVNYNLIRKIRTKMPKNMCVYLCCVRAIVLSERPGLLHSHHLAKMLIRSSPDLSTA